jgi:leader peptidase (prepilin peptidase) / N-methyltransferase
MAPFFAVLVGMAAASFIGSLSYRVPRGISIVSPRSYCPRCGRPIKPYDLIPVVSYLLLRGRCRFCGAGVPIQYFAAEMLLGPAYILMYLRFGLGPELFIHAYLVSALFYLALVDIDWRSVGRFDPVLPYLGGIALLVLSFRGEAAHPPSHYLSGAAAASLLAGLSVLIVRVLGKRSPMGGADLLIVPGIGLHFGMMEAVRVMVISSLLGILTAVFLLASRRMERGQSLPMLPFLAGGVFGSELWMVLQSSSLEVFHFLRYI